MQFKWFIGRGQIRQTEAGRGQKSKDQFGIHKIQHKVKHTNTENRSRGEGRQPEMAEHRGKKEHK